MLRVTCLPRATSHRTRRGRDVFCPTTEGTPTATRVCAGGGGEGPRGLLPPGACDRSPARALSDALVFGGGAACRCRRSMRAPSGDGPEGRVKRKAIGPSPQTLAAIARARDAGRDARLAGFDRSHCPWPEGMALACAWLEGWTAAEPAPAPLPESMLVMPPKPRLRVVEPPALKPALKPAPAPRPPKAAKPPAPAPAPCPVADCKHPAGKPSPIFRGLCRVHRQVIWVREAKLKKHGQPVDRPALVAAVIAGEPLPTPVTGKPARALCEKCRERPRARAYRGFAGATPPEQEGWCGRCRFEHREAHRPSRGTSRAAITLTKFGEQLRGALASLAVGDLAREEAEAAAEALERLARTLRAAARQRAA